MICLVGMALVLLLVSGQTTRWYLAHNARVGWSRSEIIRRLGPPQRTLHSRQQLVRFDQWHKMPQYPVEKEVLVYLDYPWRLYVYVDRNDRVRHVAIL